MLTNRNKGKLKGKSIDELLKMTGKTNTMSKGTIDKRLSQVAGLFTWAKKNRHIVHNYAEGLGVSSKDMERKERNPFEASDVQKLVEMLPATKKRPDRFWIPLIGAYTGARLNEICQLYCDDFIEINGIPCFRITGARPDQNLKNKASKRNTPIHPVLIKLGFLTYVEECRARKQERLWPALTFNETNGYCGSFSNWFRLFKNPIINDSSKVFHSFRHAVAQMLKGKALQETLSDILGHEQKGTTAKDYQKAVPELMLMELKKLDYGLDLVALQKKSLWC